MRTGCPFGQVVKDNTRAAGTRIKSNSCSKIAWSLFWNFSQVNVEGEWKTSTVTGPYTDALSISFSAMFFFTSKYWWVSLYPVLSRTCHELPNKQRWRLDKQPWVYFVLVLRASHWTQSIKVRTSKQHNSFKILQSLRNQETREKLNLNQKSSLGKANEIENTKRHGSATFLGLYTMKKRTPWSAKFAVLFPKLLTNLAPCSLETLPLGVLWFFGGNQKIHSASKTSDIVAQRAS